MRAIGKSVDVCDHPMSPGARRFHLARKGIEMRLLAIIVMLCMMPQLAVAQIAECKAITDADTRLACYDRVAKPAAAATAKPAAARATAKPALRVAAPPPQADGTAYVDSISSEDALMNARLRNICRGC
jgi:hypothetical protein